MRQINDEFHFESTGKWGVTKWFRIPERLCADLESFRTSDFVFGSYPQQLRRFLDLRGDKKTASRVREDFAPENLGEWMYRQIADWSKSQTNGPAYLHIFRKTALQYAVTAGHVEQSVADDASVTSSVLMKNYASNGDEEFRQMSNRTYRRIRSSLSVEVATRYGWNANPEDGIVEKLDQARNRKDWEAISQLAQELNRLKDQKSDS